MMATSTSDVTGGGLGFSLKWVLVPGNNAGFWGKLKTAPDRLPYGSGWLYLPRPLFWRITVIDLLGGSVPPTKPVQAETRLPICWARKRGPVTG
jgi:hypothetical protein